MDTQLVIVTGMSGAGKSSTAKGLARQCRLNGIPHRWLEEETRNHPITAGEFGGGGLREEADLDHQIPGMLTRWEQLVRRIRRSRRMYIIEGVYYQNIIRYFYVADYPPAKIAAYYDALMERLAPVRPLVVFLRRADVRATLESMYPTRGPRWQRAILDHPEEYRYITNRGLQGDEGVYAMWQAYQDLAEGLFERIPGRKVRIDTSGGDWEGYLEHLTSLLGLQYHQPEIIPVADPLRYCGRYEVKIGDQSHSFAVRFDGAALYVQAFLDYMKLHPLGGDRFTISSFPIELIFLKNRAGQVYAVRAKGEYDWDIMGHVLRRSDPSEGE